MSATQRHMSQLQRIPFLGRVLTLKNTHPARSTTHGRALVIREKVGLSEWLPKTLRRERNSTLIWDLRCYAFTGRVQWS
jgi:hypothetical protein